MWPGGTHVVVGTLKISNYTPSGKKNYTNEWMNELMNEKPQKHMSMSNVLFPSLRGFTEIWHHAHLHTAIIEEF